MSLKQKTLAASRWSAISALLKTGLQLLQVAVLARLLMPADFGLMAVAGSIIAVLTLFVDLGLSRAIVHFEEISLRALHSLFWLNLVIGLGLSILFALAAPFIEIAFKLHGLADVLLAISPFFFLSALGQQFYALAEKHLRFSALAANEIISAVAGFLFATMIAVNGGGAYSLVGGILISTAVGSILAWTKLADGYRPGFQFNLSEIRPHLRYGGYILGESFLNIFQRQSDIFIAGLIASPAQLGTFSVPRDLSLRIGMIVNPIITRIGFPVMSRLQGNKAAVRSVYLDTQRMTASLNFPIYTAVSLFASEIVNLLYGTQWTGAVNYLRMLAIWGLIRSTYNPIGSLLHAVGAVRLGLWWNIILIVVIPPLYWISANSWGLSGLSAMMIATQLLLFPLIWRFLVFPLCDARFSEYLAQSLTPMALSLATGATAYLATRHIPHGTVRLLAGCVIGAAVYLALSRTFNRRWFDAISMVIKFS